MGWWGWLRRRLDVLLRKEVVEAELDDEIRFHLEMEIRERVASGMSPEEARREALIAFGGVERYKEEVRDVRGVRVLDDWVQDTRVAIRSFAKEPAFLVTVLFTLGLGMAGNVAMFGIIDAFLLSPLPYPESERLVMGRVTYQGDVGNTVSGPDYLDYREQVGALDELAAYTPFEIQATVTGRGQAERVVSPLASHNLFTALGVEPFLGRTFTAAEGEPGAPPAAILTHGYWQQRFASDPAVVGQTLRLDGTPTTVVGILPQSFEFTGRADVWRPMIRGGPFAGARQFHNWILIGRLAPNASLAAAQAEVDGVSARLAELYPDSNREKGLNLTPLRQALAAGYRSTLIALGGAMTLLLVVACANVGGVLLARGSTRRTEMAIRASLGAGRGRILRQFFAEGAVLVAGAALLGTATAGWLQRGMLALLPLGGVAAGPPGLSLAAVGFALLAAGVTVGAFGAIPAATGSRSEGSTELRARTGASGGVRAVRFRGVLVICQVTLTVVLLMMSGLLVRSLSRLYGVETGFSSERLLTAEVHLPPGAYRDMEGRALFYGELRSRISEIPGVVAVGLIDRLPVRDPGGDVRVAPPPEWGQSGVFGRLAFQRRVLPGYFGAMDIPLLAGRDFEREDDRSAPNVMIVSESLAESLFPGESALGRALGFDSGTDEPAVAEVVGVVGDVTSSSLAQGPAMAMYFPYGQRSSASMRLAVRTTGEPAPVTGAIREALRNLDPDVPLAEVASMDEVLHASVSGRRAVMVLLGTFAVVALILAAVGLYGVLAYQVARRRHEIGVRMALGSSVSGVVRSVLRSGFVLVVIGLVLGLPTSLLAQQLIRGLLFQVGPGDPIPYLAATFFLGAVGFLACALPARRAARVDPVVAFRAE